MVKIREASFNDFENIKILKNRYGLQTRNEEWQHLWKNNPIIINIKKHWPIGWVIENDDYQIVGYFGNIPIAYEFKGKNLIAAVATSFVVDVNFRNYSILLAKNFFTQKGADLLLMTTANYEAGKVYAAFKAHKVPLDSYDMSLFWITNYQKFILSAIFKKGLPFSSIISYPLSLAMWGVDKLIKRNRCINQLNREIQSYAAFDERFDVFWENLKNRNYNRLLCIRNNQYLNWHFKYAIVHKKLWIFVTEKKSQITGYAIFIRNDAPKIGLKRIMLVDLQTIDDNLNIIFEMISSCIERCKKEGIHILEIIGFNSQKRIILEKYSPYKRKLPTWPFFFKTKDKILAKRLENPDLWDPCLFDGDSSL